MISPVFNPASSGRLQEAVEVATSTGVVLDQSQSVPKTMTNSTYVVAEDDLDLIANRAGTITVTLPTASEWAGRLLNIKTVQARAVDSASANVVLIGDTGVNNFEPALVFDFKGNYFRKIATASTFAASITHTRASSATMVNASGTLVTVGNNVPRIGHHIYNGSAWVNEGILHESEARTNLMTSSGDLTGTGWTW
jgi:hypothetical protein